LRAFLDGRIKRPGSAEASPFHHFQSVCFLNYRALAFLTKPVQEYSPAVHRLRFSASAKLPTNPGSNIVAQETLGLRRARISLALTLLMSASSLVSAPSSVTIGLQCTYNAPLPLQQPWLLESEASVYRLSPIIFGARSLDESAITHCLNGGCF
jgi:hypothetical protein